MPIISTAAIRPVLFHKGSVACLAFERIRSLKSDFGGIQPAWISPSYFPCEIAVGSLEQIKPFTMCLCGVHVETAWMPSVCPLQSGVMRNQKTFYEKRRRQFGFPWHHSRSKDPNSEKLTREKVLPLCKWDGAIGLETEKKKDQTGHELTQTLGGSLGTWEPSTRRVDSCKHFKWPQASPSRTNAGRDNSAVKCLFGPPGPDLSPALFVHGVIIPLLYLFCN